MNNDPSANSEAADTDSGAATLANKSGAVSEGSTVSVGEVATALGGTSTDVVDGEESEYLRAANDRFFTSDKWLFSAMLVSAIISLIAAFVLSVDAVKLAANPNMNLSCDINSVVSCGTVAKTWQASLFGFPNAFLGLMTEPIIIVLAVVGLSSGFVFKKWVLVLAQFFYLLGLIFALWLFYQSAFVIHAFCPWCLLVTLGTSVSFFTLFRLNAVYGSFSGIPVLNKVAPKMVNYSIDTLLEIALVVSIFAVIFVKYGSSFFG